MMKMLWCSNKDTTRPTNEYYGINWGYRADNTIQKSLNTGDLLFFDYHCDKCLYPTDLLKCYYRKYNKSDEFSQVGFWFKTPGDTFVIFSYFGKLAIMPYSEFLNRPYISRIKARNFLNPPIDISKKTYEFIKHVKSIHAVNQSQETVSRHSDKLREGIKDMMIKQHTDKIVGIYFNYIGVLRINPISGDVSGPQFDLDRPNVFHKDYKFAQPFLIRTELSKDLKDNANFK